MKRHIMNAIAISVLILSAIYGVRAQTQVKPLPQVIQAPYQLAAEDGISINVINFSNLSHPSLVVPPDGKITVPLLDPIDVVGKTTDELARLLTERWKKYVINPSVTVTLTTKRKENVLFFGFISRPGTVEYRPTLHL